MTTDKFLKIFKICPLCKSKIEIINDYHIGSSPIIRCVECADFIGIPDLENIKLIEYISMRVNGYKYEFIKDKIFIYNDVLNQIDEHIINCIDCEEHIVIKLFKRPKKLIKYILLS